MYKYCSQNIALYKLFFDKDSIEDRMLISNLLY